MKPIDIVKTRLEGRPLPPPLCIYTQLTGNNHWICIFFTARSLDTVAEDRCYQVDWRSAPFNPPEK